MERNTVVLAFNWTMGLEPKDAVGVWIVSILAAVMLVSIFGPALRRSERQQTRQIRANKVIEGLQESLVGEQEKAFEVFLKYNGNRYTDIMVGAGMLLNRLEGEAKASLEADLERLQSLERVSRDTLAEAKKAMHSGMAPTEFNLTVQIEMWQAATHNLLEAISLLDKLEQRV